MKRISIVLLFTLYSGILFSQNLYLEGKVTDRDGNPVPGVVVRLEESALEVFTSEDGKYTFPGLKAGTYGVEMFYMGQRLSHEVIMLRSKSRTLNYTVDDKSIQLDAVTVSARKKEEYITDVPLAISVLNNQMLQQNEIWGMDQLSSYVPGFFVQQQSTQRPYFVIRGMASDNFNPSSQPRVSVYFNNVPISRSSGSSLDLFDMDRVEVVKGPVGALLGRGAMNGSVQYISNKANSNFEGKLSVGTGSFNQKIGEGMVNVPVNDKLAVRFAAFYEDQEGYVDNSFGGTLNGRNSTAGRLSFRFLPSPNTRLDFVTNYQKNDAPGVAFMSRLFPNSEGEANVFSGLASFEQGEQLGSSKDNLSFNLDVKHYFSDALSVSSVTSYRIHEAAERWDGDGSAARALDFSEEINSDQFYQELRLNYSLGKKFKAVTGGSYISETIDQTYMLMPNEQHFFHLFFNPMGMITPGGQPVSVPALPIELGGMPLPTDHEETSFSDATNKSTEVFFDGSYQIFDGLTLSAGIRAIFDEFELSNKQENAEGSAPSTLGMLSGSYPNLLFSPRPEKIDSTASFSGVTGNVTLQYQPSEKINLYAAYSIGRRPNVLQTSRSGNFFEVLDEEIVKSFDAGIKTNINRNLLFNLAVFYQDYSDFQTNAWDTDGFTLIVKDGGKASSYGLETDFQYAFSDQLKLFANYGWLFTEFADEDSDGTPQAYAGNRFRLAPEHSFSVGFHANYDIRKNVNVFINPSYTWQSKVYFEDLNTEDLSQEAYGLLNLQAGVTLAKYNTTISAWARNMLDEEYLISGGNAGSLFQIPTFVPGAPQMFGVKLTYQFSKQKKKVIDPAFSPIGS